MAESSLHLRMKSIMRDELEEEGYVILEEPKFPPSTRLCWSSYRPDLLGYKGDESREDLVVVECETHPSMARFGSKNFASFWFQPYIFRQGRVRWVLAIPQGKLHSVDMMLRRTWEIWILGHNRPIWKFDLAREIVGSRALEHVAAHVA
jgi:hypothetical protein